MEDAAIKPHQRESALCRSLPHLATACADEDNLVQEQELAHVWPTRTVQMKAYGKAHFPIAQVWARHA
jgi:hypothetical protein